MSSSYATLHMEVMSTALRSFYDRYRSDELPRFESSQSRYGNKPKGASPCMFSVELCSADTGVPMFCWRRAGMVHRGDQLAATGSHAA
jgi:hypothetical protein